MNRDVIAIGASAGGVEVLLGMVEKLPADLSASIFITVHSRPDQGSLLPELLSSRGKLPAEHPEHHQRILRSHIYVAPPDTHLLVRDGYVEVVRGPKENGHRPAVDVLFRSASAAYKERVIGVVLSGYLDCGTAGMMSIKARGGVSVVQDPASAVAPQMPESVIKHVEVDYVVAPPKLPELLVRLSREEVRPVGERTSEQQRQLEGSVLGDHADIVCPVCQGVLTVTHAGDYEHFRCHVGHAFSLEALASEQSEALERALWAAVRSLEEGSALSRKLAGTEVGAAMRTRFSTKARTLGQQADMIRQALLYGEASSIPSPTSQDASSIPPAAPRKG